MTLVLLILAFLLLVLAATITPPPHVQLGWLGLAFFVLAQLYPMVVR